MHSIVSRRSVSAILAISLAACGGGTSTGGQTSQAVTRTMHGAVAKGPLVGASVAFFHVDGAGNPVGAAIGSATTDALGHVTAGLPQVAEPILAVTSGGSYVDEADDAGGANRRRITLTADQHFEAIVPANANTFVLTPYSMAVLVRARRLAEGVNFAAVYQLLLQQATDLLGLDPTAVIPADPLAPGAGGDARYGLMLGGAAYAIGTMATNLGIPPDYAVVRAFIDDLSDGRLDGKLVDQDLQLKVQSIGDVDLNGEIVRFRNNHFGLYGNLLAQIDENVWSVDPPIPQVFPPVAASDAIEVLEGGNVDNLVGGAASVLANDADPQDSPLTAALVTPPTHGELTLNADGTFTYVHDGSETTTDQFTYKANNGVRDSVPAVVVITILPVNDLPVALDEQFGGHQEAILAIEPPGVLLNDTDADGETLQAEVVDPPSHGTLTLNPNGGFTFEPAPGFVGSDQFTYRASDGHGFSNAATVQLSILPAGGAPVANDDSYRVSMNGHLNVLAPGVLRNDRGASALAAVLVTPPPTGELALDSDGSFTYDPPRGFIGRIDFQYRATSAEGESGVATVHIFVQGDTVPGNRAPVGVNDAFTWTGITLHGNVLANDADADGDDLSALLVSGPTKGTLTLDPADGSFTYDFSSCGAGALAGKAICQDQFTYRVSDGQTTSGLVTVTIDIEPGNHAPVGNADSYVVDFGGSISDNVLDNDVDPDGDPMTVTLVADVTQGTLTLDPDGSFTYTHVPPVSKAVALQDHFSYQISDGSLTSGIVQVTITINRAPSASGDSYTVDQGGALDVVAPGVLANDSDVDGNTKTAVLDSSTTLGTLTLNPDGSFHYQNTSPGAQDQFTYHVFDGRLTSSTVTVTLMLNHAPTGTADSYVVNQGGTLNIAADGVLANDTDPDGDAKTAVLGTSPTLGSLALNADGSFSYTNTVDGVEDSFTYRVSDGSLTSDLITVTITINHAPIGAADAFSPSPGQVLVIAAPGVLANDDPDPEGDGLSAVVDTAPTKGTLILNADGSFLYQPFSGVSSSDTDQFTYRISDGLAQSAPITVTLDYFICDCSLPLGRHGAVLTQDGSTVVFLASDQNLVPGKTTSVADIFITTLNPAITAKASRAKVSVEGATTIRLMGLDAGPNDGDVTTGTEPTGDVIDVNVTPDGHYVVFTTYAKEYGLSTTGFSYQVYRYTLFDEPADPGDTAGEIVLVSSKDGPPAVGNGFFNNYPWNGPLLSISDNGQFVGFHSDATDLTSFTIDTVNSPQHVYLRDITNTETTLVSVTSCGGSPADASAYMSSISADGNLISFESKADDMTGGCAKSAKALTNTQTFVRDVSQGLTFVVSVDSLSNLGDGDSARSRLSPDGSLIAIETFARNLVPGDTTDAAFKELIVHNISNATAAIAIGDNLRVSRAFDGGDPDGASHVALNPFSLDNKFLTFASSATNLVDASSDTNNVQDIFVYDLNSDAMARVNLDSGGNQAVDGSRSERPAISRDGSRIAFDSNAINFDDPTGEQQIYVVDNPLLVVPKYLLRPAPRR